MPIYLQSPNEKPRGPDGQGLNRMRINIPLNNQCALMPKCYAALKYEARNTVFAKWGSFGACFAHGECQACSMLLPTHLSMMTSKVLVRVDEENVPWIMNKPTGGWGEYGEPVTWSFFARLEGWEIGDRYKDGHSEGFWILLLNADVLPPGHGRAVGVDVVGFMPVGRDVLFASWCIGTGFTIWSFDPHWSS